MSHRYSPLEFLLFPPTRIGNTRLAKKLSGKTVVITGASFGIGERLACMLASTGAHLVLVARTESKLKEVQQEVQIRGGNATIFPVDVSKQDQVEGLAQDLLQLGRIDYFINNAGKSIMRPIDESLDRYHDFIRTMSINYLGPVQLMLSLIPLIKKSKGHIINVSAVNVLLAPAPYWAAYQASKSAFDNWFRCLTPELRAVGVTMSSIYFPLVRTRMIEPTAAYRNAPAMSADHAARWIGSVINTRKPKKAPWWLVFGQLGSVLFRGSWEGLTANYVKRKNRHAARS